MAKLVQMNKKHKSLMTELSQVSLPCSFTIFKLVPSQPGKNLPIYTRKQANCTAALWTPAPDRGSDLCISLCVF